MNRILILGCSGSGKTTLTRKLAERIGAEPIFLDSHFWRSGWKSPESREEWHSVVSALAARDRWVMDGTYDGSLHLRLPRADTLIFFETNRIRCLWRVLYRWLAGAPRPELPEGCPDKVDWEFVKYIWTYDREVLPEVHKIIGQANQSISIVRLSGIADSERWLATVPAQGREIPDA